jgi:hypothetical protein
MFLFILSGAPAAHDASRKANQYLPGQVATVDEEGLRSDPLRLR